MYKRQVPKFDAARGIKFLTYAAPAIRNAMMDMVRDAFAAFEQRIDVYKRQLKTESLLANLMLVRDAKLGAFCFYFLQAEGSSAAIVFPARGWLLQSVFVSMAFSGD